MTDLASLRQITVPSVDFSTLGNLGDTYRKAKLRGELDRLPRAADGSFDFQNAAEAMMRNGEYGDGISLAKLGELTRKSRLEQSAGQDFSRAVQGIFSEPQTGNSAVTGAMNPDPSGILKPNEPRGIRNNNPGNIEDGPFASSQPGYVGGDGRFARFATAESGMGAAGNLLGSYGKRGINTINGVISRWAPSADGNNVQNYSAFVSRRLGISPDDPIDLSNPQVQRAVSAAMAEFENGRPVQTASASAGFTMPSMQGGANMPSTTDGARPAVPAGNPGAASRPQMAQAPAMPSAPGGFDQSRLAQSIPALVAAAANPNLPQSQRELAKTLLTTALDGSKMTDDQKEYIFHRSQGGTESFTDWMRGNRRAGATAITNDMRGENEEAKAIGKAAGERAASTMSAASMATKSLATISRVEGLLNRLSQGKLEPTRMTVSAWAKSFGLDDTVAERLGLDPKKVGDVQALQALVNESVLGKIGPGGIPANNFSDADREFVVSTAPRLANDPRGNKIIVQVARRVAQRDIEKAKGWMNFRRNPANKGRSFDEFDMLWADKVASEDLFGDLRREAEALIGGQNAAPPVPGARQAPDGNFYVPDPNRPGKYLQVQ